MGSIVDFFKGILTFDWLKTGIVAILGFLEKVFNALGGIGIDLGFKKIMPFGALSNIGSTMADLTAAIKGSSGHPYGTANGKEGVLKIKIEKGYLGIPDLSSQQVFSLKHSQAEYILSDITLKTDIDTSASTQVMGGHGW